MGFTKIEHEYKENYVKEELRTKYGYTNFSGKSYRELKSKLAAFRAMDVKVDVPESNWF